MVGDRSDQRGYAGSFPGEGYRHGMKRLARPCQGRQSSAAQHRAGPVCCLVVESGGGMVGGLVAWASAWPAAAVACTGSCADVVSSLCRRCVRVMVHAPACVWVENRRWVVRDVCACE